MDITSVLEKYKTEDTKGLLPMIERIIQLKNGKWDKGLEGQSQDLTLMLIYEYATSLEKITNGKLSSEFVIKKLAMNLGTLRFGDFKKGQDDNIFYGEHSVTSEGYKKHCRINANFGAHQVEYKDGDRTQFSIALYDDKQEYQTSDGKKHILSGIRLDDLDDIRHTIFHELTHVMEKNYMKASDLKREDILLEVGDSIYINTGLSADFTMQEYKDYIESVDSILESNQEVLFNGISTIEINERKSPDRRIMHNQIGEGGTELIAKLVMESLGRKVKDKDRYKEQSDFVEKIFLSKGLGEGIAEYLTASNRTIKYISDKSFKGKDVLHYADDFITLLGRIENYFKDKVDESFGRNPALRRTKEQILSSFKSSIVNFWNTGKIPDEQDIEKFYSKMKVQIPKIEDEGNKVKMFMRIALNYPQDKKEFEQMLEKEFPNSSLDIAIEKEYTENGLVNHNSNDDAR